MKPKFKWDVAIGSVSLALTVLFAINSHALTDEAEADQAAAEVCNGNCSSQTPDLPVPPLAEPLSRAEAFDTGEAAPTPPRSEKSAAQRLTEAIKSINTCEIDFFHSGAKRIQRCLSQGRGRSVANNNYSHHLCYRAVKLGIEKAFGIRWWSGRYARDAGPSLLQRGFHKITVNRRSDVPDGAICVYGHGRYGAGHIEIHATDGHVYSDHDQGKESGIDWGYKLKGCYVKN